MSPLNNLPESFIPVRLRLPDHRSRRLRQFQQGKRVPSTTKVAVLGHILGREQKDRQSPGDRRRDRLDDPRNSGLGRTQLLADHRLNNVMARIHQSRPQRPGQTRDRRTPLDPLLA